MQTIPRLNLSGLRAIFHVVLNCCSRTNTELLISVFFLTNISQCFAYLKNILLRLEIREFYVDLQNADYQLFLKN